MPLILDASVTVCWAFPDEQSEMADSALNVFSQEGAVVPLQWWFEIRNVLVLGERRRRITPAQSAEFFTLLHTLPIRLDELPDSARVLNLARKHGLSFYDAAYLELAKRENLPLATLDNALADAARAESIALI